MHTEQLRRYLDHPAEGKAWLRGWRLTDVDRAHQDLVRMATLGLTLDLMATVCDQLSEVLPRSSDPDMALNNFERFMARARNPLSLGGLLERDREALPILVQIFSTSQYLSDLLINDPAAYDLLRMTEGQPVSRQVLVDELVAELEVLADERMVCAALRRFKQREYLRICYGDLILRQRIETVTSQISHLAETLVEGAVFVARRALEARRGVPRDAAGRPARFAVLGMGKLGGNELNYSSDIDLIFLYDGEGQTDGPRPISNGEFFDRVARDVFRLLTEKTEQGYVYRVDLRLRPEGSRGAMVPSLEQVLHYYDVLGRTWERQAFVKARPVAGDLELGCELLTQLEPWIYRRYLGLADITGIKALKRRIEQRADEEGANLRNVKTGRGGIRDIEFAIQFLQLLNGGDLPELRVSSTLVALARLEQVGCLTAQERGILEENYSFLRTIEHRLQIMFDLQTHMLPDDPSELAKLAVRLGYESSDRDAARAAFEGDYRNRTELNRKILDHLLHDAFGDDPGAEPEVDLVLDPEPEPEQIEQVLGRHGFRDAEAAYRNLISLSTERVRFLSTRRCRHFLASIAPRLLQAIAATPDPDQTLVNLEQVSNSLGGKGVLWELFSFNPPSLRLYVDMCAFSPFLSGLLTSHPGMIDELMDSLVLNKLPSLEVLRETLADLCRAAEDVDPILHSFKNAQQLRVGVRDLLGKEDILATTGALSDIAEVALGEITRHELARLLAKWGQPTVGEGPRAGEPCELVILALGKLGGRELNYHSDLDVVFLYEDDGPTVWSRRGRGDTTTNQHFFSELGQRIIKVATRLGPQGRLYEIDPRLRPTGRSGALATSLAEFRRYFQEGQGQLWERQALCRARIVYGSSAAAGPALSAVAEAIDGTPWEPGDAASIRDMRRRLEETAGPRNIKRGPGGMVDVEFLTQMLQLKHGRQHPEVRVPGTLAALERLARIGAIQPADVEQLAAAYRFLRTAEARLRLMNATSRDDLPDEELEQSKLARLLGYAAPAALEADFQQLTRTTRATFERIFAAQQ